MSLYITILADLSFAIINISESLKKHYLYIYDSTHQ